MNNQETGAVGEKLAVEYLSKRGHRMIQLNYRCPHGEIDIISLQKNTTVFTEVKCRRSREFGMPSEALTQAKQRRLTAAVMYYLQNHSECHDWRIDVIAIELGEANQIGNISVIENALQG